MATQHRFDYSHDFAEKLASFAKENINEDRKKYKTNWMFWKTTNINIYNTEIQHILNQGFAGNPHEKIYESVRYYYRKKLLKPTTPKNQSPKQKLAPLSNEITEQMDKHIVEYTSQSNTNKKYISPAAAFSHYCETNQTQITKEIYRLKTIEENKKNNLLDPLETENKFKKSYKNRFYTFLHLLQSEISTVGVRSGEYN
jgi:hypothetical protein